MRRFGLLPLLALGLATTLPAFPGLGQDLYRDTEVQRLNKYKAASAAFQKALEQMNKKNVDGALDALRACFEQVPEYPDGRFMMARILYSEKEYTRALAEIVKAREGHEKFADLQERMKADKYKPLQERITAKDNAIFDQSALLATAPGERRRSIQDKIQQLQSEKDVLTRELQEWSLGPEKVPSRYSALHGTILLRLGKPDEAVPRYEEALAADPANAEAANNLASIHHMAGRNEKAMEIVKAAKQRGARLHPELEKSIEAALARRP